MPRRISKKLKKIILNILEASIKTKRDCIENNIDNIIRAVERLTACITTGHKVLIFGNGGSAADAQHLAAEFVNRFQIERPPLAAVALTTDTSIITSIGNDYHFDDVFSKQVEALGKQDDIAWGISTSGNSTNVIKAIKSARKIGMTTIGMTGRGGELAACADLVFSVPSDTTARIQESHITLGHILCDLMERKLYPDEFRG
ncbi:MAG: D-sedoheptulose 7-phosphate isomerase [Desulfobacterales bacterium]|nr:MAG: D-sedoheptulose 7-phosphate isomerase [Desulfobacterales bacterium]